MALSSGVASFRETSLVVESLVQKYPKGTSTPTLFSPDFCEISGPNTQVRF